MKNRVDVMDKDVTQVQEEHREALRMAEIERFIESSGQGGQSYGCVDSFLGGVEA